MYRSMLRAVLIIVALCFLLFGYRQTSSSTHSSILDETAASDSASIDWNARKDEVRDVFVESRAAYSKYAWGQDRFHPVSTKGSQMSPDGMGWIIVDSLDTMMIMNLTTELAEARKWVSRKLNYDQHQDVNTFETTIRMLGGLLSAHYLTTVLPDISSRRDHIYLEKAKGLADKLLGAYTSASGIPYASIMLDTGVGIRSHADGGSSSTAEATTVQLEMKYLSQLTGNATYWEKAEKAMAALDKNNAQAGLVPIFIEPESGSFTTREIRLGSRGDSYYEYLIKQYLQTAGQEPVYRAMWDEALDGIEKHLLPLSRHSNLWFIAELPTGISGALSPKMDHLVCFLPGAIALSATEGLREAEARALPTWTAQKSEQMQLARELTKTCYGMYAVTATGLAPEIVFFDAADEDLAPDHAFTRPRSKDDTSLWRDDYRIKDGDAHNLQRPETVESLFVLWRVTGDVRYREWGWEIFTRFREHSRVRGDGQGYTSLDNVKIVPAPQRDSMESFWLAETLKYLYLLFAEEELLPLTEVVFNTEAHPLPVLRRPRYKTGWTREPR